MATHSSVLAWGIPGMGPVFLPGKSQGQGSLVGCPLWGRTESDMTEATQQQLQQQHSAICKSQDKISILIRVCTIKLGATVKTSVRLDSPWKYLNSPLIIFSVGLQSQDVIMKKWNNIFFVKKDPAKMHIKMSNVGLKYVTWNVFQLDQFFFYPQNHFKNYIRQTNVLILEHIFCSKCPDPELLFPHLTSPCLLCIFQD